MRHRLLGRRAALAAGSLALTVAGACTGQPSPGPSLVAQCPEPQGVISVGEKVPTNCSLDRFEGGLFRTSSLRGKPAVINFWASWCTFCIDEMPAIQNVYATMAGRVTFVGADLVGIEGETREAARVFGRSTKVRYPLVFDTDGLFYGNFGAPHHPTLPVTIFIAADGRVTHRQFGPLTETILRNLLRDRLGVT